MGWDGMGWGRDVDAGSARGLLRGEEAGVRVRGGWCSGGIVGCTGCWRSGGG